MHGAFLLSPPSLLRTEYAKSSGGGCVLLQPPEPGLKGSGPPRAAAGPGTQRERLFPQHRRQMRKCSGVKQSGRPRGVTSEHLPEGCWTVSLGNSGVFVALL